jgi:hypothetical protein
MSLGVSSEGCVFSGQIPVTDAALSYRRYQLGTKPFVTLFRAICKPMASLETKGAFLFGLRLMAIDGTVEDVADTPENARTFGRQSGCQFS